MQQMNKKTRFDVVTITHKIKRDKFTHVWAMIEENEIVSLSDASGIASIQKYGVISENKSYVGIPTASLAARLAARDLKPSQSGIKKFKLVFDRRAYAQQPMSVFKISAPERGIDSMVLRAIRVEHNNISNGEITITAIQDVFGLPATSYIKDQPSLWEPPNSDPQPIVDARLFEVPYANLLDDFTVEELSRLSNQAYIMPLALQPNSLQQDFNILAKTASQSVYNDVGDGQFIFSSLVIETIPRSISQVIVMLASQIDTEFLTIGQCAVINNEIMRVNAINTETNQVTLARGCIDTVPVTHAANSRIWFYSGIATVAENSMTTTQVLNFKLLSRTFEQEYDAALASVLNITAQQRVMRPYPPAHILINDLLYPVSIAALNKVSWKHRNRITQGTNIVDQSAATTTRETDVTYSIKLYKKITPAGAFTLVAEQHGMTATEILINPTPPTTGLDADLSNAVEVRIELYAVLNSLQSLQQHSVDVLIDE